jgi:hypothetical protein
VAGLDGAAGRSRRRRMRVGALDETGQAKQGSATAGVKGQYMGCAGAVKKLLKAKLGWEVRSAGTGLQGRALVRLGVARVRLPGHTLLLRRHLKTGELAFRHCYVPEGRPRPRPA